MRCWIWTNAVSAPASWNAISVSASQFVPAVRKISAFGFILLTFLAVRSGRLEVSIVFPYIRTPLRYVLRFGCHFSNFPCGSVRWVGDFYRFSVYPHATSFQACFLVGACFQIQLRRDQKPARTTDAAAQTYIIKNLARQT